MTFKFIVFAALVTAASAGHLGLGYAVAPAVAYGGHESVSSYSTVQNHAAPIPQVYAAAAPAVAFAAPVAYAAPVAKAVIAEPSAPAHYDFGYVVNDPHTGYAKNQQESRRGDIVHGSYSLLESDGTKRTVEYSSDPHNGFNAVVHKEPASVHVKTLAPAIASVAAPLSEATSSLAHGYTGSIISHGYSAPIVAHGYAAPVW